MIWKYSRLIERGEMDLTPEVAEAIACVWKDITSTRDFISSTKGCLISDAAE